MIKNTCFLLLLQLFCLCLYAQESKSPNALKEAMGNIPHNLKEAERILTVALDRNNGSISSEKTAKALALLGVIKYYDSKYYLSNDYITKALNTSYAKSNALFRESCYNNMGVNYEILNQLPEAISSYNKSLQLAEKRGDSTSIAQTWINLGLLDSKILNYKRAEAMTNMAMAYFSSQSDSLNIALCSQNLALIAYTQKEHKKAIAYAEKALTLHKALRQDLEAVKTLYIIADSYYMQGKLQKSDEMLNNALTIATAAGIGMEGVMGDIYEHIARNKIRKGSYADVEELLERSKSINMAAGLGDHLDDYYHTKAHYYVKTGNYGMYEKNHSEYIEYLNDKSTRSAVDKYHELQALYNNERKEARILAQQKELQAKNIQLWGMALIVFIAVAASVIIAVYYYRMRTYARRLYRSGTEAAYTTPFSSVADNSGDKLAEIYNSVVSLMEKEKLYLQTGLNMPELSRLLSTNDKYISQAINTYSKSNFNVFLNKYRVNHAKKLLIENGSKIPLKAVSSEAGFASHTTFYRQFKEFTGLTPMQFMEMSEKNLRNQPGEAA